jgi:hypothetical protein
MAKSGDAKIASIIRNRFTKLHSDQVEIFDEVEKFHAMYRSIMTQDESYPWEYQYVDPQIFPLLRNTLARLNPDGMQIYLEGREEMDDAVRRVNQELVNWELGENSKTMVLYRNLFRGLLAGRAYLSTGWHYEPSIVISPDGTKQKMLHDIVNRAEVKNVRFQDMFIPNRNIPELYEQPYLIERVSMSYGDMEDDNEMQEREVWKKDALKYIKDKKVFSTQVDYGVDLIQEDGLSKDDRFIRSQYVSLIKMQTKDGDCFYILEDGKDTIVNTDDGSEYLHNHYNYIDWAPFPEDDEYFSLGIVQPVADLQEAMSSVLNQYLTTSRNAGNPMTIIGGTANEQTPDWMFVKRPNGIVRVKGDINQIREYATADPSPSMLNMRNELQRTFERASSMSSLYSSGVATGAAGQINTTARGASIINQNIDTNMQLLVSIFGAMALRRIGEHFLELNAQYITEEQVIRITGKSRQSELLKVSPDEVSANFDVLVSEKSMLRQTPEMRQATLLNIKGALDKETQVKLDKRPIYKAILEANPDTQDLAEEVIVDTEFVSEEHINSLLKGIVPEVSPEDDHKMLIMLVQKHLMDNDYDDSMLDLFNQYMNELRKWVSASNPNFLQAPPPQPPPMLPSNEEDLMASMASGVEMGGNPTEGQAVTIPEETLEYGV